MVKNARTVYAVSPNIDHYKGWEKVGAQVTFYFKSWMLPEFLTVLPEVNRRRRLQGLASLTEETITERYDEFGGTYRIVYGTNNAVIAYRKKKNDAINRMTGDQLLEAFETADEIVADYASGRDLESKHRVSSTLFTYVPSAECDSFTVIPTSPDVLRRIRAGYIGRLMKRRDTTDSEYCSTFEVVAGIQVAGSFEMVRMVQPPQAADARRPSHLSENVVQMPPSPYLTPCNIAEKEWSEVVEDFAERYSDASEPMDVGLGWTRNAELIKPNNPNQPVIDFFEVAWLRGREGEPRIKVPIVYQATTSLSHPIAREHLGVLLDRLGCTPERPLVLVFVVPSYTLANKKTMVFDNFKTQNLKPSMKKKKKKKEHHARGDRSPPRPRRPIQV